MPEIFYRASRGWWQGQLKSFSIRVNPPYPLNPCSIFFSSLSPRIATIPLSPRIQICKDRIHNRLPSLHKTKFNILLLFVGLLLFAVHHSIPALTYDSSDSYHFQIWNQNHGIPQSHVIDIAQTQNGYLWLATPGGLVRFDGLNWTRFDRWNTKALIRDRILCLHVDLNDVLWIGTDGGGLVSFDGEKWNSYTTLSGLSNNNILSITTDRQGRLWIGTEYGLNRKTMSGFQIVTDQDGLISNIVTALESDPRGFLWIGTLQGGLMRWLQGSIDVIEFEDSFHTPSIQSLHVDRKGNLWAGSLTGLFFLDVSGTRPRLIPGTGFTPVNKIQEDESGQIWFGTMADGLKRLSPLGLKTWNMENGFPDDHVKSLLVDNGFLWAGTETGGLIQLKPKWIQNITRDNGLTDSRITTVIEDHTGTVWAGTRSGAVFQIQRTGGISTHRVQPFIDKPITALMQDHLKRVWIGTDRGIFRYHNGQMNVLAPSLELASDHVTSILQDSSQRIWIGTQQGLTLIEGGENLLFRAKDGLSDLTIQAMTLDAEDNLIIGTGSGLYQRVANRFSPVDTLNLDVSALCRDSDNRLWLGTQGQGLWLWDGESSYGWTIEDGLPDNFIHEMITDSNGQIWGTTPRGIFRVSHESSDDSKPPGLFFTIIDQTDGMNSAQCSGGSHPSLYYTQDEKLLVSTGKGLSILDIREMPVDTTRAATIIEEILVDGESISPESILNLNRIPRRLTVRFTSIDFMSADKIRFRYRLSDQGNEIFSTIGMDRKAEFYELKNGKYHFVVQAAKNGGAWGPPSRFTFNIQSPFSRISIPIILSTLIILSAGYTIYRRHRSKTSNTKKYSTSTLDPETAEKTIPELIRLMEEEKQYLNPDLTLKDLAKALRIHYNHLSRIINERFGLSYNDFVNKYRIEEAQRRLHDPDLKNKSISDIMYDSGFYSKSVFNTAFKKLTGKTPSQFRKLEQ